MPVLGLHDDTPAVGGFHQNLWKIVFGGSPRRPWVPREARAGSWRKVLVLNAVLARCKPLPLE